MSKHITVWEKISYFSYLFPYWKTQYYAYEPIAEKYKIMTWSNLLVETHIHTHTGARTHTQNFGLILILIYISKLTYNKQVSCLMTRMSCDIFWFAEFCNLHETLSNLYRCYLVK